MIEIKDLDKSYGKKKVLNNINLKLEWGKVYGLLGRNGVGKTTLLRILSNQIVDYQGDISFDGEDLKENQDKLGEISMVQASLFSEKSLMETRVSQLFKMAEITARHWDWNLKYQLIDRFSLNVNEEYRSLSQGEQNLVRLIIGLCNRTKLTIFDEPNLALDANNRYLFYEILMEDLANHPRTIIIASHVIDELENILEEIVILKNGQVLLQESLLDFKEKSLLCRGREEEVKLLEGKNIIHRESMGVLQALAIYDNLTSQEKEELRAVGVEISKIPLQKAFTYLTN